MFYELLSEGKNVLIMLLVVKLTEEKPLPKTSNMFVLFCLLLVRLLGSSMPGAEMANRGRCWMFEEQQLSCADTALSAVTWAESSRV